MSTDGKVTDLQAARRAKREKSGWTREELRQQAKRDAEEYRRLGTDEPANLASGVDMKKIISGAADHDEADED
jgi:hypothetical protein